MADLHLNLDLSLLSRPLPDRLPCLMRLPQPLPLPNPARQSHPAQQLPLTRHRVDGQVGPEVQSHKSLKIEWYRSVLINTLKSGLV